MDVPVHGQTEAQNQLNMRNFFTIRQMGPCTLQTLHREVSRVWSLIKVLMALAPEVRHAVGEGKGLGGGVVRAGILEPVYQGPCVCPYGCFGM